VQTCQEWAAAETLAQYEHSLSRANAQVEEATKRNRGLMEALTALRDSALRSQSTPAEAQDRPPVEIGSGQASGIAASQVASIKSSDTKSVSGRSARAATAAPPANQIGLFKPDVDLIMKVNSLEQQLGRSQDEAKLLRRQLNESDRRLQEEQQRNRSLKGA
jgi:predicted RNase H-like nuclease (RuvC/YqgF family)